MQVSHEIIEKTMLWISFSPHKTLNSICSLTIHNCSNVQKPPIKWLLCTQYALNYIRTNKEQANNKQNVNICELWWIFAFAVGLNYQQQTENLATTNYPAKSHKYQSIISKWNFFLQVFRVIKNQLKGGGNF